MAGNFFGGQFFGGGFFGVDKHDGWRKEDDPERERKRTEEFLRSKEQLRADVEKAWNEITGHAEPAVVKEAMAIAKPAMAKAARQMIASGKPAPMPNFDLLSQFRLRQLMQLHQDLQDEEEILMFMDD